MFGIHLESGCKIAHFEPRVLLLHMFTDVLGTSLYLLLAYRCETSYRRQLICITLMCERLYRVCAWTCSDDNLTLYLRLLPLEQIGSYLKQCLDTISWKISSEDAFICSKLQGPRSFLQKGLSLAWVETSQIGTSPNSVCQSGNQKAKADCPTTKIFKANKSKQQKKGTPM
jgi:hypothetical protein